MAATSKRSVEIVENYKEYTPPLDVKPRVQGMIVTIPEKYLLGLRAVVLTNQMALSHKRRRGKTWSRRQKVRQAEALGLYHHDPQGSWIELFVDNLIECWGLWFLRLPFFGNVFLGETLFHELGHHIHQTARHEHREREDVADSWKAKLPAEYVRKEYWYMMPVIYPAALGLKAFKWLGRALRRSFRTFK